MQKIPHSGPGTFRGPERPAPLEWRLFREPHPRTMKKNENRSPADVIVELHLRRTRGVRAPRQDRLPGPSEASSPAKRPSAAAAPASVTSIAFSVASM